VIGSKKTGTKYQMGLTAVVALKRAKRVPTPVYKIAKQIRASGTCDASPSRRSITRAIPLRIAKTGAIIAPSGRYERRPAAFAGGSARENGI
jgi:hypothetical protein